MQSASQIYDPSMKKWSSITSTGVYYPKVASLALGKVLVLGGTSIQVPNAQLCDEISGWTSAPTPTFARYPNFDFLIALATGDALVAGGVVYNNCNSTNEAEVFRYCPSVTFAPGSLPPGSVTVAYSLSIAASGGTGTVTYAVTSGTLPAGLTPASGGTLSGTPSQGGTFPFTVTETDAQGCTGSKSYSLTISCPTITVSPTNSNLPYGRGGSAYDQAFTSTGGIGATTFSVTSGALPGGLTLASDGALTGTPTVAGNFNFTVTSTDTATCKGSQAYSLPIYCPSFVFTPASLADGTAGTPYATVIIVANGALGAATYVVDNGLGTPPPGMTLASDGTLSGTPTQSGTFGWIVSATDASGCMHSAQFYLTIDPNPDAGADDAGPDTGPDSGLDASASSSGGSSGGVAPAAVAAARPRAAAAIFLTPPPVAVEAPVAVGGFRDRLVERHRQQLRRRVELRSDIKLRRGRRRCQRDGRLRGLWGVRRERQRRRPWHTRRRAQGEGSVELHGRLRLPHSGNRGTRLARRPGGCPRGCDGGGAREAPATPRRQVTTACRLLSVPHQAGEGGRATLRPRLTARIATRASALRVECAR